MASGLTPATHTIPALRAIICDLFVVRAGNRADAGKDLDTQREVLVSMMLRLVHYYQVRCGSVFSKNLHKYVVIQLLQLFIAKTMGLISSPENFNNLESKVAPHGKFVSKLVKM